MSDDTLSSRWGRKFGLARSPMFAADGPQADGQHDVLLDGGHGSFGLSVVSERCDPAEMASWAWSSDLPHHVAVGRTDVQVVRWDAVAQAETYSLASVERDLDGFYRYLCQDRLRSNRTVVQHLINLFGRIRTLVFHARIPDDRAIDVFLTVLADLIAGPDTPADPERYGLAPDAADLRNAIAGPKLEEAQRDILTAPATLSMLRLKPTLAVRHAGGQLFQEAHFDLVRAPPPDMFGYVETATAERKSRGGTHYTPPALARSIVDHTVLQIDGLADRRALTLSDPACGSAAFLHEALRGLERVGFQGALRVVGRDISPPAVAMARFTLKLACRDWEPDGGVELDINPADSLAAPAFAAADMTVMNPPFISVIAQTSEQKAQLRDVVGDKAGSRGDFSMAFVVRALDALTEGGAMGTVFPANLLTLDAAAPWRKHLAREGQIRLLASLGDFGMFSQALVHVACAIVAKGGPSIPEFTALVTDNAASATGDALRALRKANGTPPAIAVEDKAWKLFSTAREVLDLDRPWRILTPHQREIIDALEAAQTPTVEQLFDIVQGAQTGNNKVFLYDADAFRRLGLQAKEKRLFRDALMTDSIEGGRIVKTYHLFYPHGADERLFETEAQLASAVPTFYHNVLKYNEESLKSRATIRRSKRPDWWGLMHPRAGSLGFDPRARIVSKYFGLEGSFVLDAEARFIPSTGHVWLPKRDISSADLGGPEPDDGDADVLESLRTEVSLEILRAYVALLNSRVFMTLASFRSVTIAGGQLDLSSRFLGGVYLPNLWEKGLDQTTGVPVRRLAAITAAVDRGEPVSEDERDRIVAQLYGVPELAEA